MGEALVSYVKPPLAKLSGRMDLDQDAGHTDCRVALWTNTESLLSIQVTNDDLKLSPEPADGVRSTAHVLEGIERSSLDNNVNRQFVWGCRCGHDGSDTCLHTFHQGRGRKPAKAALQRLLKTDPSLATKLGKQNITSLKHASTYAGSAFHLIFIRSKDHVQHIRT